MAEGGGGGGSGSGTEKNKKLKKRKERKKKGGGGERRGKGKRDGFYLIFLNEISWKLSVEIWEMIQCIHRTLHAFSLFSHALNRYLIKVTTDGGCMDS